MSTRRGYRATSTIRRECEESPIEGIYSIAFKSATALGEHKKGAHIRGLEAVYDWALTSSKSHPIRMMAYRGVVWLRRKLRPWDGGTP